MQVQYLILPTGRPRDAIGFKTIGPLPSLTIGACITATVGDTTATWRISDLETVVAHGDGGHITDAVVKVYCAPLEPRIFDKSPKLRTHK